MRFFIVSIFLHVLIFSFMWVGLSVPKGHEENSFTYLGDLVGGTGTSSYEKTLMQTSKDSDTMMFENSSSALFTPWLKMRQGDKPH